MTAAYVELHVKSFYSFGEGASHIHELLAQAGEYGYTALALTDANLCGALEFARLAGSLGILPITGGELTLANESRLVLLARTREGYANISRLFTLVNAADRREPRLDPARLSGTRRWSYIPHRRDATGRCPGCSQVAAARTPADCSGTSGNGTAPTGCTWNSSRIS